tara:strand:- start:303 stop:638 length:336 start_codon:yes stop_codon:yes gene_type:complete
MFLLVGSMLLGLICIWAGRETNGNDWGITFLTGFILYIGGGLFNLYLFGDMFNFEQIDYLSVFSYIAIIGSWAMGAFDDKDENIKLEWWNKYPVLMLLAIIGSIHLMIKIL